MTHVEAEGALTALRPAPSVSPRAGALRALLRTSEAWAPTVLRVALGAVILPHGAQKAFGWFGGGGIAGTLAFFREALSVPAPLALLVIVSDSLGAAALILGLFTRVAAAGAALVMLGAIAMVHSQHGFFMNWFGTQAGEGFEFHILALAMLAVVLVQGGGRWSVDRRLLGKSASSRVA